MRSKSEAPARSSPALAVEMPGCNLLGTRHADTAKAGAFKPLPLGLRTCMEVPVQPNIWMNRKDSFAKPERNTAVFLGFIPQF